MTELKPCPFCGGTKFKIDQKTSSNKKYVDSLEKRIEDYKHLDVILNTAISTLAKDLKAKAYKEFAEKVKTECYKTYDEVLPSLFAEIVDKLLNELVGDGDEN